MGARIVRGNGQGPAGPEASGVAFDYDEVVEELAGRIGQLTATIAVQTSVINGLRAELAKAKAQPGPDELGGILEEVRGKVRAPASKEATP